MKSKCSVMAMNKKICIIEMFTIPSNILRITSVNILYKSSLTGNEVWHKTHPLNNKAQSDGKFVVCTHIWQHCSGPDLGNQSKQQ